MRVRAREGDRQTAAEHLAEHSRCQWRSRLIECVARAEAVVVSREGVLRSSCADHVAAWIRTGGRVA